MLRNADTISPSDILIEDPLMEPFFITKSQAGGYTLFERVSRGKDNKPYLRTVGYFSNFGYCLRRVAKELLHHTNKEHYSTIKEYIETHNALQQKMSTLTEL
jgi:hypothetical protein